MKEVKYTVFYDREVIRLLPDYPADSYVVKGGDKPGSGVVFRSEMGLNSLAKHLASIDSANGRTAISFNSPDVNYTYNDKGQWFRSNSIEPNQLEDFTKAYVEALDKK
jgi:hypothetical protein